MKSEITLDIIINGQANILTNQCDKTMNYTNGKQVNQSREQFFSMVNNAIKEEGAKLGSIYCGSKSARVAVVNAFFGGVEPINRTI